MREALAQLARHSGVFLIGLLFQRGARVFLLPLYFAVFTPAVFGLLEQFETFIQITAMIFSFALPTAYIKFYRIDAVDGLAVDRLRGTTLALTAASLVLAAAALPLLKGPASWLFFKGEYTRLYLIAGFTIIAYILFLISQGFLRAQGRAVAFVVLSTVQFLLLMFFNIYFIRFRGMGIEGALYGMLLGWGLPTLIYAVINARAPMRFDVGLAKQIIWFALPLVPFSLIYYAVLNSGRFFLLHFFDAGAVGIFSAANRMGLVLMLVTVAPFQTAWSYLGLDFLRLPNAREVYARTFTYLMFGGLWIFLGVSAAGHAFILIFGHGQYVPALPYIDIMMFGYLIHLFFYWGNPSLSARNYTGLTLLISLAPFAIAVGGGWLLIPRWGIAAAGGLFTAALTVQTVITVAVCQHLVGFQFEAVRLGKILAAFVVVYTAGLYFMGLSPLARWFVAPVQIAAFPALLWLFGFLNQGEIARLREVGELVRRRSKSEGNGSSLDEV